MISKEYAMAYTEVIEILKINDLNLWLFWCSLEYLYENLNGKLKTFFILAFLCVQISGKIP